MWLDWRRRVKADCIREILPQKIFHSRTRNTSGGRQLTSQSLTSVGMLCEMCACGDDRRYWAIRWSTTWPPGTGGLWAPFLLMALTLAAVKSRPAIFQYSYIISFRGPNKVSPETRASRRRNSYSCNLYRNVPMDKRYRGCVKSSFLVIVIATERRNAVNILFLTADAVLTVARAYQHGATL